MTGRRCQSCLTSTRLAVLNPPRRPGHHAGASLRAAFLSVQQYGACEEALFPYEERTLQYSPNKGEEVARVGVGAGGRPGGPGGGGDGGGVRVC